MITSSEFHQQVNESYPKQHKEFAEIAAVNDNEELPVLENAMYRATITDYAKHRKTGVCLLANNRWLIFGESMGYFGVIQVYGGSLAKTKEDFDAKIIEYDKKAASI